MARILVHALAARLGGGANYFRNFLKYLQDASTEHEWLLLQPPDALSDQSPLPACVRVIDDAPVGSGLRRAAFDQFGLARLVKRERADLILATANFGMSRPPVPQILLNRNALYFSSEHIQELRRRREFAHILETLVRRRIAMASIRASAVNVTPTEAFGDEIARWMGWSERQRFVTIPFGLDHQLFRRTTTLDERAFIDRQLSPRPGVRRILLVSHFNYFRNFDTLIRSLAILKRRSDQPVELILTTRIAPGLKHHRYDSTATARLIQDLDLADDITMLGPVSSEHLPSLYERADVVVCPSYAESFGHPMVEAMASGRPLVVADRGVHREICQGAAVYFPPFDDEHLAFRLMQILEDPDFATLLGKRGVARAAQFDWRDHFRALASLADQIISGEVNHVRTAA